MDVNQETDTKDLWSDLDDCLREIDTTDNSIVNWTNKHIKLLVRQRLGRENEFRFGKQKGSVLWIKVLEAIKLIDPEFPFSPNEIKAKFYNLQTTYKRVKRRKIGSSSGRRSSTSWAYFELFEDVYGTKKKKDLSSANIMVGACGIQEHISTPFQANSNKIEQFIEVEDIDYETKPDIYDTKSDILQPAELIDACGMEEGFFTFENDLVIEKLNTPDKDQQEDDLLAMLKNEFEAEERRHKEFMEVEMMKIDIERKKLKVLVKVQELLQEMKEK